MNPEHIPRLLERASKKMTSASANSAAWVLAGEFRDYLKNPEPIRRKLVSAAVDRLEAAMRAEQKGHLQ